MNDKKQVAVVNENGAYVYVYPNCINKNSILGVITYHSVENAISDLRKIVEELEQYRK